MKKYQDRIGAITFLRPEEMLNYLLDGDLYNPETGVYVCGDHYPGWIGVYDLEQEDVYDIIESKNEYDDDSNWSERLIKARALYIAPDDRDDCDASSLDYCKEHYRDMWVSPAEYERVLMENATRYATNIRWDIDYDECCPLPKLIEIPKDMWEEDEISDYLSEVTGFCHEGYEITYMFDERPIKADPDYYLQQEAERDYN